MPQELPPVTLGPGQTVLVQSDGVVEFHGNTKRNPHKVRVTDTRPYPVEPPPVDPPPPPPPPTGRTPVPAIDYPKGRFASLVSAAASGSDLVIPAGIYHERAVVGKALRSLDLRGVRFDGTGIAVPLQDGLLKVTSTVGRVIEGEVTRSTGAGLDFAGSGTTFDGLALYRNLQLGYHSSGATDVTFHACDIHHNNLRADWPGVTTQHSAGGSRWVVDPFWEAGAGKIVRSERTVFDACLVHENGGPGLWWDIAGNRAAVTNSHIWANDLSGTFFEISDGFIFTGNVSWGNGKLDSRGWGWPADVLISSSRNVTIKGNVFGQSTVGLSVIAQDRGDRPGDSTGIVVTDNDILGSGKLVGWFAPDGGNQSLWSGNSGSGNRYEGPDGSRFEYRSTTGNLAYLNGTPVEEGGRFLTASELAAAKAKLVAP